MTGEGPNSSSHFSKLASAILFKFSELLEWNRNVIMRKSYRGIGVEFVDRTGEASTEARIVSSKSWWWLVNDRWRTYFELAFLKTCSGVVKQNVGEHVLASDVNQKNSFIKMLLASFEKWSWFVNSLWNNSERLEDLLCSEFQLRAHISQKL